VPVTLSATRRQAHVYGRGETILATPVPNLDNKNSPGFTGGPGYFFHELPADL